MESSRNPWRSRFTTCAIVIGMLLAFLVLLAFILIPIFFRSDQMVSIKEKEVEDEERRQIYGNNAPGMY
jgi:uncharacterized BrkB/YihY/UPF0761 family membrane protein